MTSQAIISAVNFIRTFKAAEMVAGEPVEVDEPLIARIEAVFAHFRLQSIEGWNQLNDHMRIYYGYGQSVWTFNAQDHVTTMVYIKGSPIPSNSSTDSPKDITEGYSTEIPEGADPWGHI